MTASEFAFLALGLVLGVASGAALSIVLRARQPAPREVRVTVSADAIPRRGATLSGLMAPGAASMSIAARGGPADPAVLGTTVEDRTPVRSDSPVRPLVGLPIRPEPDLLIEAVEGTTTVAVLDRTLVAVGAGPAPIRAAALGRPVDGEQPPAARAEPERPTGARADPEWPRARAEANPPAGRLGRTGSAGPPLGPTAGSDACVDERRLADDRCALADRLREAAAAAADRAREAQRAYDEHTGRAARAASVAEPRAVRAAKESAWSDFRRSNATSGSREDLENAAREWLQEIDRINRTAREAELEAGRERESAAAMVLLIERLSLEADAARINAESASEACLVARSALAACEEAAAERRAPSSPPEPGDEDREELTRPRLVGAPGFGPTGPLLDEEATQRVFGENEPAILKLLRGDRETMTKIVASLAGDDPTERRHWQLALSGLVDAVLARAIEASALEFPRGHPFWSAFNQEQCRDVATALASFGYRFDGLGGFVDGRIPSQRDLSLAVGYAGFDPMRFRNWPNERDSAELYRDVAVSAGEFLAGAAGELTLGEMLAVLHGRAEGLTDLWNAWGRIRPLLLQP
ncbi:MAG: hypothetical protein ABI628_03990 [Chloroflexota bacterium]